MKLREDREDAKEAGVRRHRGAGGASPLWVISASTMSLIKPGCSLPPVPIVHILDERLHLNRGHKKLQDSWQTLGLERLKAVKIGRRKCLKMGSPLKITPPPQQMQ